MRPRILFATAILSHPPMGGPELRIENSLKALSRASDVYLYCRKAEQHIGGRAATRFLAAYCKDIRFLGLPPLRHRLRGRMLRWRRRSPDRTNSLAWMDQPAALEDLHSAIREVRPDVVWLGYGHTSFPALQYLKAHTSIPVVVDTDSVWSRFLGREIPFIQDPARRAELVRRVADKEAEERDIVATADITTAVSAVDADYYRQYAGGRSCVMRFSNVLDIAEYDQPPMPAPDMPHPSIYIAGSFYATGCPMEHAVRWFVSEVKPLISASRPDAKVIILGKGSDVHVRDLASHDVICKGCVPNVLPYLGHADVVAVPLWFESGTRFKILEAGACRRAVVSTTLGAEGLPTRDNEHVLLADTPAAFAEAVCRVLADPVLATRLGTNLRDLVNQVGGIPNLVAEAEAILRTVLG